jgi:hypothetical protein
MSYQTQAAIGPYPVNFLLQALLAGVAMPRLTGIASTTCLPVPLSTLVDLPFFLGLPSLRLLSLRLSTAISYSLVVVSIADGLAIAIGSRDAFGYSPAMTVHCTGLFQYYHLPG